MRLYIISYFGDDRRDRRVQIHRDQLTWAHQQGLDVYVVQQQYDAADYDPNVTYIGDNQLRSPGGARNVALRHFYESEQDWAIFADNDSTALDTVEGQNWIETFESIPYERLSRVECFQPVNGGRTPFNKRIRDDLKTYQNNLWFDRTPILKGSFFVLKNLGKHHNVRIFQEEEWICDPDSNAKIGMEDTRFGLELWQAGFSNYMLWNAKLNERGPSTWIDPTNTRGNAVHAGKRYIANYFGLEWNEDKSRVKSYEPIYSRSNRPRTQIIPIHGEDDLFNW